MAAMTYESIVETVRRRFMDTDVSSVPGTLAFQFNVEGKASGIFTLKLRTVKFM